MKLRRKIIAKCIGLLTLTALVACSHAPIEDENNISEFSEAAVKKANENSSRLPASQNKETPMKRRDYK